MTTREHLSVKNRTKILLTCSCGALLLLLSAFVFVPELLESSFAEEYSVVTDDIELVLSPVKENRDDYKIIFTTPDSEHGSFGTVGINAKVTTANAYGYSLYVRSGSPDARLIYNNIRQATPTGYIDYQYSTETTSHSSLGPARYIRSISETQSVVSDAGSGWEEMNAYGWSKDWNPATARGTFNPMMTTDQLVKKAVKETYRDGQSAASEDTKVYIGALVNDNILPGNYRGALVFTAITNALSDAYDTYTLRYDLNGGGANGGDFSTQTENVVKGDGETGPATIPSFTITSDIPTHENDLTFLGWNTDCDAETAAYSAGDTITVTSTETTLCAIWTGTTVNRVFTTIRKTTVPKQTTSSETEDDVEEETEPKSTPKESKTEPLGEIVYEKDNGGAIIIAIICGLLVMLLTFIFLLFMKRRKEEEEELNIEE